MEKPLSPPPIRILAASGPRRPWQATLLAWLSLVAVLFLFLIVVLSVIFGFAGFKGGEMGTMIGIFAAVGLLFLLPLLVFSIVAVVGLFKGKRWALILALVLTSLGILGGLFSLANGLPSLLPTMIFCALLLLLEIICLKHPYYQRKKTG